MDHDQRYWLSSGAIWLLSGVFGLLLQELTPSFWIAFIIGIAVFAIATKAATVLPWWSYPLVNLIATAVFGLWLTLPAIAGIYATAHLFLLLTIGSVSATAIFAGGIAIALLWNLIDPFWGSEPTAYAALGTGAWFTLSGMALLLTRKIRQYLQHHHNLEQTLSKRNNQITTLQYQLEECRTQLQESQQQARRYEEEWHQQLEQLQSNLRDIATALEQLADYRLGFTLPTSDHPAIDAIITALKTVDRNLSMLVLYYQSLASNISQSATALANHTKEMGQSFKQQIEQIASLASSVEQLSSTAEEVARTVATTADTASTAAQQAQQGQAAIGQTIDEMTAIINLVRQTAAAVEKLSHSSDQITSIVRVIEEIAEQINLLALNAAIEAARAGETGRGFAVVADEIRRLAERTQQATKEIGELIEQVRTQTDKTVQVVSEGSAKAEAGVELAENASTALESIVRNVAELSDQISQIAAATQQQAQTANAMNRNLSELREHLHQTEQGLEEIVREQETLAAETQNLIEVANEFTVGTDRLQFIELTRERAQQFARECEHVLEEGIRKGLITEEELFDRTYEPIPNTDPPKYHTKFDQFTDTYIQEVEEKYLAMDPRYRFAILVDDNGYVPSHNLIYSQPLTGDYQTDLIRNRTKRIFNDPTGIRAARNTNPFLLQTYRRDTGEFMNDLSVPVYVRGKHWGAVRIGFVFE